MRSLLRIFVIVFLVGSLTQEAKCYFPQKTDFQFVLANEGFTLDAGYEVNKNGQTALLGNPDSQDMPQYTLQGVGSTANPSILLENDRVLVEIDPDFGRYIRILDKETKIQMVSHPELAGNFRLELELPGEKTMTILGRDQKLTRITRGSGNIVLIWNGPLKDTTGTEHKIAVRMQVQVSGNALTFNLHLDNHSSGKIRSAAYPLIGGLAEFGSTGKPADGMLWAPARGFTSKKIESPFEKTILRYPGQMSMAFTCIESKSAGKSLYFATHDEIARAREFRFEEQSSGKVKDVFASVRHLPFTPPGQSFDGSPVVVKVVDGTWQEAGSVYREFFTRTFGLADPGKDWIRKESFFVFTMFMLPEGTINYTFKDIPRWAKAARDNGVNAVQISGWETCGHDNGLPYYTPDPRLGTWKDLEEGIRACHEMGVKVFFFVNYQEVTLDTRWYRDELAKYREWNENGDLTWKVGWGYGSLWGRIGYPRLMTRADLGFPQFRKIITDQFEALARIGADGVHVDKMFPVFLSFNPDSPMSPDMTTWEGAILLSKEVFAACRKHNPNWAMSFECNWDRMLQFGGCTWWVNNQPFTRAVFPENAETQALKDAYDYLLVNNLVREGHHVMITPMKFSGGMDLKPMEGINEYIRDVKRIRDQLQETVFLGEVLGHNGVNLTNPEPEGVEFNVFRNRRSALRACILTNAKMEPRTVEMAGFDRAKSSSARIHQPGLDSYVVNLPATITIPAEQILFAEELPENTASSPAPAPRRLAIARVPDEAPVPELPPFDPAHSVRLEDDNILVEVSRDNGSVTRIHDKRGKFDLILEPRLAGSWMFGLTLPGKEPWQNIEANWIIGAKQKLTSISAEDTKLLLLWDGPLTNYLGEKYDATVIQTIELADSGVVFNLAIRNRTPYAVGETYSPVLGGIRGLGINHGPLKATEFGHLDKNDSLIRKSIFRNFMNYSFGGDVPEQYFGYRQEIPNKSLDYKSFPVTLNEPWIALQAPSSRHSVYFGLRDPADRPVVAQLRLLPGGASNREDGNWPRPEELRGLPVGVEFAFVDCHGGKAGMNYQAAPVFVRFYDGKMLDAKEIHRLWKTNYTHPSDESHSGDKK